MESFIDRYESVVRQSPDAPAVREGGETLTRAELWERSGRLARACGRHRLEPGETLALAMERSTALVVGILGAWRAGGAFVVLEPSLPLVRQQRLRDQSGCRMVLSRDAPLTRIPRRTSPEPRAWGLGFARPGTGDQQAERAASRRRAKPGRSGFARPGTGDHLAYIAFTSGTSGQPKGVLVGHAGLVPMLQAQIRAFAIDATSRCLWALSPGFDASLSDLGTALLGGATLCIAPEGTLSDPDALLRFLREERITHADLPPRLLPLIAPHRLPETLQTVVIGGEPADPKAVRAWAQRVRVINVYGPTEATVCSHLEACSPSWAGHSLGRPLPHVLERIVDSAGRESEEGELWLGGPAVALGYLEATDAERSRFLEDGGQRWYRTGDRVARRPGNLAFLGRMDRQVQLAGRRVEPEEVERALAELGVFAAVLPDEDRLGLVAFVEGHVPATEELAGQLRAALPAWLVPRRWHRVPSLPRGPNAKVDRRRISLNPRSDPQEAEHSPGGPSKALERPILSSAKGAEQIARLADLILGKEGTSLDEDLFASGASSLSVLQLVAEGQACGLRFTVSDVHRKRTPRRIAEGSGSSERRSLVELELEIARAERSMTRAERTSRPTEGEPRSLLLTGGTGFLGAEVLAGLRARGHRVVCLVRASSNEEARARVQGPALAGDLAKPHLGLDPSAWSELSAQIRGVVHLGAQVSLAEPYETLAPTHVDGTVRVLALARQAQVPIIHASTLSVFAASDRSDSVFFEADDASVPCTLAGGYAQSKWVAEQLVRRSGLRGVIVRYGLLTPCARTSWAGLAPFASPPKDWLQRIIQSLDPHDELDPELSFDVTPVDVAASASVQLVERALDEGFAMTTVHVAGAEPVSAARLLAAVRSCTPRRPPNTDPALHLGLVRRLGSEAWARHQAWDLFAATGTRFDQSRARSLGLSSSEVSDDYLRGLAQAALLGRGGVRA